MLERAPSTVPHVRPVTPQTVTHTHDEDFSDEDSEEKSNKNSEQSDG